VLQAHLSNPRELSHDASLLQTLFRHHPRGRRRGRPGLSVDQKPSLLT
jgi:hypothetical protein